MRGAVRREKDWAASGKTLMKRRSVQSAQGIAQRFSCLAPGLDWTRLFMSLTAAAGTRCMSLLPDSPSLGERSQEEESSSPITISSSSAQRTLNPEGHWVFAERSAGNGMSSQTLPVLR